MDLSVVAAAREDQTPHEETRQVAVMADRLGYEEVWVGEGPTWDAFSLATAIGLTTSHVAITAGPVPVSVRDPASIVRGAASAAFLIGRPVGIALGTSSTRVVEGFHGRSRSRVASALAESAEAVRTELDRERTGEEPTPSHGFRRVLPPPGGSLTIAAFGDHAISVAAAYADRMVLDLVSPDQVAVLKAKLRTAAGESGRRPPSLAAWLPAAIDPTPESEKQILLSIVGYLTVPGYSDMFVDAGFAEAVARANAGAPRTELLGVLPPEAASEVGLIGDLSTVRARLDQYADAGLDEVALVPATHGDPSGERTLTALRPSIAPAEQGTPTDIHP